MFRNTALAMLCFASFPSLSMAIHEKQGVINDTFPLTIGSPDFPRSVYSGISLTINPGAPTDLRFKTGQAAWLGTANATIVDTELEQLAHVFPADSASGVGKTVVFRLRALVA